MFRRLVEHIVWSDRRALHALQEAGSPSDEAVRLFLHVLGAEHTWISRIRGVPAEVAVWPDLPLQACKEIAEANATALEALVGTQADVDFDRVVSYRNSAGEFFQSTVADILAHVSLHGAYHRGQVALLLRKEGHVPAPTDYIAFIRGAPAAVRQ